MTKILITGGSGLVGKHLCIKLQEKGYEVVVLSRSKKNISGFKIYYWDVDKNKIDKKVINSADYIIHLAGANISERRWTSKQKELILNSRIQSVKLIFRNIDKRNNKLKSFITASAIGFYGTINSDIIFDETAPAASDFLGKTCAKWEQVADKFTSIGIRIVKIRTGIVLTKKGGALSKIARPIKLGLGSAIGNGKQYLPWIHIDDLCNIYLKAIEDKNMAGSYNAVAPEQITNKEFGQTIAKILKKPFWFLNIPAIILRIIFGEMSVILLNGSRVSSAKIESLAFKFKFRNLNIALRNLYIK